MYPFLPMSSNPRVSFRSGEKLNVASRPASKGQSLPRDVRRRLIAPLQGLWSEAWYEGTDVTINTRFLKMFFIDVDKDIEEIGEQIVDGDIPYDVITTETNERFEVVSSNVVSHMMEWGTAHWGAKDAMDSMDAMEKF